MSRDSTSSNAARVAATFAARFSASFVESASQNARMASSSGADAGAVRTSRFADEPRSSATATRIVRMTVYLMGMLRLRAAVMVGLAALAASSATSAQPLPTLGPLDASGRVTYFIEDGEPGSTYTPADRDLATWALQAWQRASNGRIRFEPSPRADALVQVHWVPAGGGQYGEMRPMRVGGRRGAAVYIRPDTNGLGPDIAAAAKKDPLLRDTIVYLTCVHEIGHALGLPHTDDFRDIMYFFGFGGDIPLFFSRYRVGLRTRVDIAGTHGLSEADIERLRTLYPSGR